MYGAFTFVLLITWSLAAIPSKDASPGQDVTSYLSENARVGIKFKDNDTYVVENVHYYLYTRNMGSIASVTPSWTFKQLKAVEIDAAGNRGVLQSNGMEREYWLPYELTKNDSELLKNSTFDPSRPTKVLCHGFMNSYMNDMEQEILDAYLYNQDVNVVAVSWATLAGSLLHYSRAVSYTMAVGKEIAQLIDFLVTEGGADISSFHLTGHSLGAHVVSFASNYVTSGSISRISGLDPALPDFNGVDTDSRLDPSDAEFVDCIHTCGGLYGFFDPLCDLDFYPNRGQPVQPGCWFFHLVGVCSHGRAYALFAASINTTFTSEYCETFEMMEKKNCSTTITGLMGEPSTTSAPGIYFLQTTGSYPFVENTTSIET